MSNLDLFYSIKSELKEKQKPFTSLNEVLLDSLDEIYPYVASNPTYLMSIDETEMDNIQGDNYKEFLKNMKLFVKKLSARLDDEVKPISEKARLDLSFMSSKKGDRTKYYPIVIDFEDGQYLIGLARQYGEEAGTMAMNRSAKFKVVRWLLNGVDINKVIYNGVTPEKAVKLDKDVIMDTSILANKIAVLVQKNHLQWIKQHPNASVNTDSELDDKISEVENEIKELQKQKKQLAKQLSDIKKQEVTAPAEEEPETPEYGISEKIAKFAEQVNKFLEKMTDLGWSINGNLGGCKKIPNSAFSKYCYEVELIGSPLKKVRYVLNEVTKFSNYINDKNVDIEEIYSFTISNENVSPEKIANRIEKKYQELVGNSNSNIEPQEDKKVSKIILRFSTGNPKKNIEFNSFNELQKFMLEEEYNNDEKGFEEEFKNGNHYHSISLIYNDNSEYDFKLDVGIKRGAFNPFKKNLSKYLIKKGIEGIEVEPDLPPIEKKEIQSNQSQEDTEKSDLIELGKNILQTEDLDQIEEMLNKFEPLMNKKYADDKDIADIYNQINEHLNKIAGV